MVFNILPSSNLEWKLSFFLLQQSSSRNIFRYWLLKIPYTKELTLEFIQTTKWTINGLWAILSLNINTVVSVILQMKNKMTTTAIITVIFVSLLFEPCKLDPKAFFISLLISITCKSKKNDKENNFRKQNSPSIMIMLFEGIQYLS